MNNSSFESCGDGWTYEATLNSSGLCLSDIAHDGHPFVKKVFIAKTYAELKNAQGTTLIPYDLGTEGMQFGTSNPKKITQECTSVRSPDYYHTLSSRTKTYFGIDDFGGNTGQHLIGKQYYSFTAPSSTPRHETTGFTSAGRFYPSLDFSVNQRDSDVDIEYIDKLRFDYYFDINVSGGGRRAAIYDIASNTANLVSNIIQAIGGTSPPGTLQAAMFKDLDASPIGRLIQPLQKGARVFSFAEKPLVWEIVADGLLNATPLDGTHEYWDNIHVWGYNPNGLVSTPGMPYGFHQHWRWASSVSDLTSLVFGRWTQPLLGNPELAGRDINNNPVYGGPLIDPRLPKQDIRVAFVKKSTAQLYLQESASAHDEFEDIFKRIKAQPEEIKNGENCVLIMSIVVHRQDPDTRWKGTIFPHGIFFPHTYNPAVLLLFGLPFEGAYSEQYIPNPPSVRQWKRNPT